MGDRINDRTNTPEVISSKPIESKCTFAHSNSFSTIGGDASCAWTHNPWVLLDISFEKYLEIKRYISLHLKRMCPLLIAPPTAAAPLTL